MADHFNTLDEDSDLPLTGGTVTGDLGVADATPTKGYRFRTSGGGLDLEACGADLVVSAWSGAEYTGTQRTYLVLERNAQVLQLCQVVQVRDAAHGVVRHVVDGTAAGNVVVNEDGAATDFRVESDADPTCLVVDGSADMVGIGTDAPAVKLDVNADSVRVRTAKTPASAGVAGVAGQIAWDASFLYVCTATNTWRRVAHASW